VTAGGQLDGGRLRCCQRIGAKGRSNRSLTVDTFFNSAPISAVGAYPILCPLPRTALNDVANSTTGVTSGDYCTALLVIGY